MTPLEKFGRWCLDQSRWEGGGDIDGGAAHGLRGGRAHRARDGRPLRHDGRGQADMKGGAGGKPSRYRSLVGMPSWPDWLEEAREAWAELMPYQIMNPVQAYRAYRDRHCSGWQFAVTMRTMAEEKLT